MIRLGALGDVARTLPAVATLRAAIPDAHIAWLVESKAASLLDSQRFIDEVIRFPRSELQAMAKSLRVGRVLATARDFTRALRLRHFDLVVDFHSILRSGVLSRLSGAPVRVSYAPPFGREFSHLFATHRALLPHARISRFERNAALARFVVGETSPAPFVLCVDPKRAPRWTTRPVAIHPGTSSTTTHKRYGAAAFGEVARALAREVGEPCRVTSGPACDDRGLAEAVVEAADGAARLAPWTPTPADLAAVFSRCSLVVGCDSGPLHVASLSGTPVVQLLGPTDPIENAPWAHTSSRTLRAGLACSPCRRGCAAADCMRAISPARVIAAARELLAETAVPLTAAAAGSSSWI